MLTVFGKVALKMSTLFSERRNRSPTIQNCDQHAVPFKRPYILLNASKGVTVGAIVAVIIICSVLKAKNVI